MNWLLRQGPVGYGIFGAIVGLVGAVIFLALVRWVQMIVST